MAIQGEADEDKRFALAAQHHAVQLNPLRRGFHLN